MPFLGIVFGYRFRGGKFELVFQCLDLLVLLLQQLRIRLLFPRDALVLTLLVQYGLQLGGGDALLDLFESISEFLFDFNIILVDCNNVIKTPDPLSDVLFGGGP